MKEKQKYYLVVLMFLSIIGAYACTEDLLDQTPTTEISSDQFWASPDDAIVATYGVYNAARLLFQFDFMYDGHSPYGRYRNSRVNFEAVGSQTGESTATGNFVPANYGNNFDMTWKLSYRVINRANYVLSYMDNMINDETNPDAKIELRRIRGENYFLRALAYFRLISLWGDVPHYEHVLAGNDEAYSLSRQPIEYVKAAIIKDLDSACIVLPHPLEIPNDQRGRASKAAAYGYRGKVKLFWASWKKHGWPELPGFEQDNTEALSYYESAADDFHKVIYDFGLDLFRNGEPGTYGDNFNFDHKELPNYWHLFQPGEEAEFSSEIIFSVQFAGPDLGQGQGLNRGFGNRQTIHGQVFYAPTHYLVNRYQLIETGDYAEPVVLSSDPTIPNGAVNPNTYEKDTSEVSDVDQRALRDWRMKATMMWDGQTCRWIDNSGLEVMGVVTLKWGDKSPGFIDYDDSDMGYLYRKWVRQEPTGGRTDGSQNFIMMRLADVFLMYSEAKNEVSGPSMELVELVNRIRHRGNLPGLAPEKYSSRDEFFKAIEQERIVELNAEGHIGFDIRRWRMLEDIYPTPEGFRFYDTHGTPDGHWFFNAEPLDYQRLYLFRIPTSEIDKNPNLTQNPHWL